MTIKFQKIINLTKLSFQKLSELLIKITIDYQDNFY